MEANFKNIQGKRVLIIDMEVDLCTLMRLYFKRKDCQVFIAHSLEGGILSVRENLPQVVMIDPDLVGSRDGIVNRILEASLDVELIVSGRYVLYGSTGLE